MRRLLLVTATTLAAVLVSAVVASAANAPAQIVNCSTATACYSPNPIRITAGTTITWSNGTTLAHTATADSGAWDTGAIATGATSSAIIFNTPGTFAYHCRFHAACTATSSSPPPQPRHPPRLPPQRRAPARGAPCAHSPRAEVEPRRCSGC